MAEGWQNGVEAARRSMCSDGAASARVAVTDGRAERRARGVADVRGAGAGPSGAVNAALLSAVVATLNEGGHGIAHGIPIYVALEPVVCG